MARHHREVGGRERDAVDAGERRCDRPLTASKSERLEVLVGGRVGALAQVQQEARLLLDLGEERLRVARVDVGDAAAGFGQLLIARLLDVADDPAVIASDAGRAEQRDPLRGRNPADERLALDVADQRRKQVGGLADRLHRRGDELVIRGCVAPLVPVRVPLRDAPQRQRVVREVVVELDQAREHGAAGLERDDAGETVGGSVGALGDRGDRRIGDPYHAVHHDRRARVHRHDAPAERPFGATGGVDRSGTVRHTPTVHRRAIRR